MVASPVIRAKASPAIGGDAQCQLKSYWRLLVCCDCANTTDSPIQDKKTKKPEKTAKTGKGGIFCCKAGPKCGSRERLLQRQRCPSKRRETDDDFIRFSPEKDQPKCVDCRQGFTSDLALYQHCRMQHATSFVDARCCNAQLYTMAAFAAHAEVKHAGQHLCIRCHEFFESNEALERHLHQHGVHQQACVLFCILCGACSRSDAEIASHLLSVHDMDEARGVRFVCRVPLAGGDESAHDERNGCSGLTLEGEQQSLLPCVPVENLSDCLLTSLWHC